MASGMKYMFAIECSKPAATKAEIGNTIATALSTTLRPASAIQIAMHTSRLQSTPRKNASVKGIAILADAILSVVSAIAPSFMVGWFDSHTSSGSPAAPTKFAMHNRPVAQYLARGDLAGSPGHGEQVVAGEQLRARDHHQQQAQTEHQSAEHALKGEAKRRVGNDDGEIKRSQTNECPCQDAEERRLQERQSYLGDADPFHLPRNLFRRESIESIKFAHLQPPLKNLGRMDSLPAPDGQRCGATCALGAVAYYHFASPARLRCIFANVRFSSAACSYARARLSQCFANSSCV